MKKIINYFFKKQFIRFSISGGMATLVDIVLLYAFTEYLGIWYLLSSIFSFLIGSATHFCISRYWVFKNFEKSFWQQYLSFSIIHFGGLAINITGLYILVEYFSIYYIVAKIAVVVLGVAWIFFGNKKFTFSTKINNSLGHSKIICPLCANRKTRLLYAGNLNDSFDFYEITKNYSGKHAPIYKCHNCKLAFIADDKIKNLLIRSYDSDFIDITYESESRGRQLAAKNILSKIKNNIKASKLLDIGCYTGLFLLSAKNHGFNVYGLEPSIGAVKIAQEKGLKNIQHGFLDKVHSKYVDKYFDVITAIDVIEHLNEPKKMINFANNKLKIDGQLVISTPNFMSLLSKLQKNNWHAVLPHHLYYFSFNNLKRLLEEFGFEIDFRGTQARYFSTNYLLERIKGVSPTIYKCTKKVVKLFKIENKLWLINFFDQLLIIAHKKQDNK